VIAESDLNDPKLIRPPEQGGYGLDAQWSDDFHHAVHAALTGERGGYYADFGGVDMIAAALREPFVYAMRYAASRDRRHGAPSTGIPRERFVVAIQNHDQVGNRASGDRLAALLSFDQLKLAAALLLLSPYVPLLFMGEEYAELNSFQYFISHSDPQLVEAVRKGRREEFAAFGWGDALPDPQAEATFVNSRLDRARLEDPRHAGMVALYTDLIAVRRRFEFRGSSFENGDGGESRVRCRDDVITIERQVADGGRVLAVFNCSDREHEMSLPEGSWELVLSTDDARYGGQVTVVVQAAARRVASRSGGQSRASGDEWKGANLETRTSKLAAWTAAVYAAEAA
jgi:maltooligosyltrehalose trehalohydrolase